MTLTVKHAFVSQIADNPNAAALGEVLPQSHWNAVHVVTGTLDPSQLPNNIGSFNASGSVQATTGTISAGSTTLSLGAAQDFQNGQGIAIFGAGPVATVQQPTGLTLSTVGTAGSTTHTYQIASVDAFAGVGVAIAAVTITTANATLDLNNYIALTWTAPASGPAPTAYAVYRDGVFLTLAATTAHNDVGTVRGHPSWCPSTPPAAASSDMLVTSITSGGGTTSLTLAVAASTTVSSAVVNHDDTVAVTTAMTAAIGGKRLVVPDGTYLMSTGPNLAMTGNVDVFCTHGAIFKAQSNMAQQILGFEDFIGRDQFSLEWRGGVFDNSGGIFGLAVGSDSCFGTTRVGPLLFDGVTFQGAPTLALASISCDTGLGFTDARNVIITNCKFFGQGDAGIYGTGGGLTGGGDDGGNIVINNNTFQNCSGAVNIKRQLARVVVDGNTFDTCFSGVAILEAGSGGITVDPGREVVISNNIFSRTTSTPICVHARAVDTNDGSGIGITLGSRCLIDGNLILDWGYLSDNVTPYNGTASLGGVAAGITIQGASQVCISNCMIALADWAQGGNGSSGHRGIYVTQFVLNSVTYNPDTVTVENCHFINVHQGFVEDASAPGLGPNFLLGCTFRNVTTAVISTNANITHLDWDKDLPALRLNVGGTEIARFAAGAVYAVKYRTFNDTVGITKISRTSTTLNFGTVNANSTADLTVTVTGLTGTGSAAWVNPQAANLTPTGISYYCTVQNDQVTVRAINSTTSNVTLPSGTYIVYGLSIG